MSTAGVTETISADHLGWKPHWMRQRDGSGGWVLRPAEVQFIHHLGTIPYYKKGFTWTCPFGVAQMDNGEIILVGTIDMSSDLEKTAVCFSGDGGQTWTELRRIGRFVTGRPMSLTYLGGGSLMFLAEYKGEAARFFSKDYGRTWKERVPPPVSSFGRQIGCEGNYLVDRDDRGPAQRIAGFGWMGPAEYDYPVDAAIGGVHWSKDGGRTWSEEACPAA